MKKALAIIATTAVLGGLSQAGDKGYIADKAPMAPAIAPCYGSGFEFGGFAAGIFPGSHYDDALGGGVSLGYFFNENFGLDFSAAWYTTDSEIHNYTLDAVYRIPFDCIAPYLLAGAGAHTNGATEALFRFGGGVDFRLWETTSLFADATYNILGGDIEDYTTVRVGLRFAF